MPVTVFAILLAAGFSKRFGKRNKLLEPFRGKPLCRHTLDLVCTTGRFEKIFFIHADDNVAAAAQDALASDMPVTLIRNNAPEKGRGESVRLGVAAADKFFVSTEKEHVYYMFFPCDQPLLDANAVNLILDAAQPGCIIEPFCGSHNSPTLFSAAFRDELLALNPGESPLLLKSRHPDAVIKVKVSDPAVLADIDTASDLEHII